MADFQNGSSVLVEAGAVFIIYGTLNNSNNSNGIVINGELIVHGNFTGGNGSTITGTGTMDADGSISTGGSGSVFGSTNDCTAGPCSGNDLCGLTNALTSGNQTVCSGNSVTITGDTPTGGGGTYTYLWESSTTSAGAGFASAAGTNNTKNYITGSLTDNTWFRRKVMSGNCTDVSEPVQIAVISGGPGTWIGITSSDWATASNWCGEVPTSTVDVVIHPEHYFLLLFPQLQFAGT